MSQQKSYTQKDLVNDYNKDKKQAKKESGILALIIIGFLVFCFLVPVFNTNAQPKGQLASGVKECVQLCTTQ